MDTVAIVNELLTRLGEPRGSIAPGTAPAAPAAPAASAPLDARTRLAHLLTVRPPDPIDPETAALLDRLLAYEAAGRPVTRAADLPRVAAAGPGEHLSLWLGDITTLAADAIVNAANDRLLGCWIPGHRCIDNVIHAAAGPRLRADCAAHMAAQGHPEPTGTATLTPGHHLPARYVLHTVGPIVSGGAPTDADAAALASCYRACLDVAHAHGDIASVAFCSISTGVFGYPVADATRVALDTVADWLEAHPAAGLHVVFNTFSDADTAVYRAALARVTH